MRFRFALLAVLFVLVPFYGLSEEPPDSTKKVASNDTAARNENRLRKPASSSWN